MDPAVVRISATTFDGEVFRPLGAGDRLFCLEFFMIGLIALYDGKCKSV